MLSLARLRVASIGLLGMLVGGVTLSTAVADPGSPAEAAVDDAQPPAGSISIVRHPDLAPGLAEVRIGSGEAPNPAANRLLAISPDGRVAAVAGRIGPDPSALTLAHDDGSQVQLELPGLIAGGFAPDGSWLAALDGAGSLWRVGTADGSSRWLADGPFIGEPLVEPSGSILALRVSSVEAPIISNLVRVSADGSAISVLSREELVYGVERLADGTLAIASHRDSRTVVLRLRAGGSGAQIVDLGEDAVNVTVSPTADAVAYERSGQIFLQHPSSSEPGTLGRGSRPKFAADGRSLLVELPTGSALIDLEGRTIASFSSQAAFADCGQGCES